jgi:fructokinase
LCGAAGAPLVAITRGGDGAVLAAARRRASAGAPPVEVADTIGAGDSFMSALLAGLLTHDLLAAEAPVSSHLTEHTLDWLATLAVEAAAVTCSRPGADPPWPGELPVLSHGPGDSATSGTGA